MTGSSRRRPAQLSGSRGSRRGVDRGRGSRPAPRGPGPESRMGRRGAKTPIPGGRGGPRRRAGSSSRYLVPQLLLSRPGKRGLPSEERGSGFGIPRGRGSGGFAGPETARLAWPGRVSCFCGAAIGDGEEEFFLCLCTCEYLERRVRVCVLRARFLNSEPLRCVAVRGRC